METVLVLARIELTFLGLRGSTAGGLGPDRSLEHSMSCDIITQHIGGPCPLTDCCFVFGFWISWVSFSGAAGSLLGTGSVPVTAR